MKKVLFGLMTMTLLLAACGGKGAATQPANDDTQAEATAEAANEGTIGVPAPFECEWATKFATIDIDGDRAHEVWASNEEGDQQTIFRYNRETGSYESLADFDYRSEVTFFDHGVQVSGSCGTGCLQETVVVFDADGQEHQGTRYQLTNPETDEIEEQTITIDGDEATLEVYQEFVFGLGDERPVELEWTKITK